MNKSANPILIIGRKLSGRRITTGSTTEHNITIRFAAWLLGLLLLAVVPASAYAQAMLTVESITWDVIGLDSNDVSVGPSQFPVGVRACNTGDAAATNVNATFNWDSSNTYINLRSGTGSSLSVSTLAVSACTDFYFEVEVTRNAAAYDTTREYHIAVTADGGISASSPIPRELFIERLISQNRNSITDVQLSSDGGSSYSSVAAGGTMDLMVGQTYHIRMIGSTATQGYGQIETFSNLPNTIFQVLSVETTYSADTSAHLSSPHDMLYGDACLWEDNPLSPNYRSCLDDGKAGGNITVTYEVRILSVPTNPLGNPGRLSTLIYDFSGSSYHYNADFGTGTRFVNAVNATLSKSFAPKTINPGGTSTLTFTITNPGPDPISSVNFIDDLPAGVTLANQTVSYSGCGTPSPATGTITDPLTFTNITVAGLGTCTIDVTVTAATDGSYDNVSQNLFIDTDDTGSSAQDTLVVSSQPPPPSSCTTPTTMATWTMPTTGQGSGGPPPPYTTIGPDVATATATAQLTGAGSQSISTAGVTTNAWEIRDAWTSTPGAPGVATGPYFQFAVDSSNYGGVQISLQSDMQAPGDWTNGNNNHVYIYSSADGINFNLAATHLTQKNGWRGPNTGIATTSGVSTTWFRITADTRGASKADAALLLDNITISGCPRPDVPTLSKSFASDPILEGSFSVLTFTLANPNATTALTGVGFTDTLPSGLLVDSTPNLSTTCSFGTGPITATAGSSSISLAGATLNASESCTISVRIEGDVAGVYTNTSDSITSTETGPNTTATGYGTDDLTVIDPPVISKAFGASNLIINNSTSLAFSINNPNIATTLTGVAFTDTLPGGLVVANPNGLSGSCGGGTITATAGSGTVSLSGATLAAGASCSFSIDVTGNTIGLKQNSVTVTFTGPVSGTGNTATADVLVRDLTPALSFAKKVSTSSSGPWLESVIIPAGDPVWYQFTVENTGDAPFDPVTLTDDTFSPSCTWSPGVTPLPVADASDDDHIATCVVQNGTAAAGSVVNTAFATGTYNSTGYNSANDTASYQNGNFGHLPSAYTNMNLYNDGGSFHLNGTTYLGSSVTTTDTDGINNPTYTAKGTDDGITWGTWASDMGEANIDAECPGGNCYVCAWFDWTQDGDFDDTGDYSACMTVNDGSNTLSNIDYSSIALGNGDFPDNETYYARFRIYPETVSNPQPNGVALNNSGQPIVGEIEDYEISSLNLPITLSSVDSVLDESGLWVNWTTATETGNAGFHLYGRRFGEQAWLLLNEQLIPSQVIDSLDPQRYHASFPGVAVDELLIEDWDLNGQSMQHGPFAVGRLHGFDAVANAQPIDWAAIRAKNAYTKAKRLSALKAAPAQPEAVLWVTEPGVQRIGFDALQAAGADFSGVSIADLALTDKGKAYSRHIIDANDNGMFDSGDVVEFPGSVTLTLYSARNAYRLVVDRRLVKTASSKTLKPNNAAPGVFSDTVHKEQQRSYSFAALGDDPWYDQWLFARTNPVELQRGFDLPGYAGGAATLSLRLWGVTNWPDEQPDHHLIIKIKGQQLDEVWFDGNVDASRSVDIPAGLLQANGNILTLEAPGDTGHDYDIQALDSFSISYERHSQAHQGTWQGELSTNKKIQLDGFQGESVAWKGNQRRVGDTTLYLKGKGHWIAADARAMHQPSVQAVIPAPVAKPEKGAVDYIIVSHPQFIDTPAMADLEVLQQSRGYSTAVIDVDTLYAAYSDFEVEAEAIRRYLKQARPLFVLLVGADSYDYHDYLGLASQSFVPTHYARSGELVTYAPTDSLHVDFSGNGISQALLGRLPVRTEAELNQLVSKLESYVAPGRAVLAAGPSDGFRELANASEGYAAQLSLPYQEFYSDDLGLDNAKVDLTSELNDDFNAGGALVSYVGHSSYRIWGLNPSHGILFWADDARALNNPSPHLVTQWGCWNTYYVNPRQDTMANGFLFQEHGAAAVLGAASLTELDMLREFGETFFKQVGRQATLGEALRKAQQQYIKAHPEAAAALRGFALLGDPAAEL